MSSSDSGQNGPGSGKPVSKKRRTNMACDMCKKRKIRCVGDGKSVDGRCSNCDEFDWQCTYENAGKKYPPGYVKALQTKIEKLEKLLKELHPDEDFTHRVGRALTRSNWMQKGVLPDDSVPEQPSVFATGLSAAPSTSHSPAPSHSPHPLFVGNAPVSTTDADDDENDIVFKLNKLSLQPDQTHVSNFYGRSSIKALIMGSIALNEELGLKMGTGGFILRPDFWGEKPWESAHNARTAHPYQFPEPDLLPQLIELYFSNVHIFLPALHQPSFRENLRQGLHLRSRNFAAVVLLVCAIGASFSDDPRVILENSNSWHSAGYEWFSQVQSNYLLSHVADVFQIQVIVLSAIYLKGRGEVSAWTVCGMGIRLAQNSGIHRKPAYGTEPTIDEELFKRSFWTLILLDRWLSSNLGRPCAIVDDDFDVELPVDCDEEYWSSDGSTQAFKQPKDQPSKTSAWIWMLKLSQIMGSALRTLHASYKTKRHHGFTGSDWEHRAIAFYDSALNQWLESLPEHLRWEPPHTDEVFHLQSAFLKARFHEMQIIIHRPFIVSQEPSALPSLAICANASRACARVIDAVDKRYPGRVALLYTCAFTSGAVLFFNVGSARRLQAPVNPEDLSDAQQCMGFLKSMEMRWQSAGRSWDALNMIASLGQAPLKEQYLRGQKRAWREEDHGHPDNTQPASSQAPATAMLAPDATNTDYLSANMPCPNSQLDFPLEQDMSSFSHSDTTNGEANGANAAAEWSLGFDSDMLGVGASLSQPLDGWLAEMDELHGHLPGDTFSHDGYPLYTSGTGNDNWWQPPAPNHSEGSDGPVPQE